MTKNPKWVERARAKMGKEWRSPPLEEPGPIVEVYKRKWVTKQCVWVYPYPFTSYDVYEETGRDEQGREWVWDAHYLSDTPPGNRPLSRTHFRRAVVES